MKKLITLTALTLLGTAAAITVPQRTQHVNQVVSAAGFTLIDCPSAYKDVTGYNVVCVRSSLPNNLFQQAWDLYADWSSKVTLTAKHVTAWKSSGSNVSAGFEVNGDRYVVVFDDQLDIALVGWSRPPTDASGAETPAAPTSVPGAILPARLTATAAPTRTGPLNLNLTTLTEELSGPVKTTVEVSRTVSGGTETPGNTVTRTYTRDGRLLTSLTTDAKGAVTASETITYEGTRMTRRVSLSEGKTTTRTYTYDPQGNLLTANTLGEDGQPTEITRYVAYPNGYSSQTFGKTGPATSVTYTLQDARSRVVRSELSLGSTWMINEVTYSGDQNTGSNLTSSILDIITTQTPAGKRSVSTWKGSISLPPSNPTVFTREQLDQYGNPAIKRQLDEVTEFGATTLKPTKITTITYTYY